MKNCVFYHHYVFPLIFILFCQSVFCQNEVNSVDGAVYYRVLHFTFESDIDLSKVFSAFDNLNSSSSSVKCAMVNGDQLSIRIICIPEVSEDQIILYAQKKGFEISLLSNEVLNKISLKDYFLECKGVSKQEKRIIAKSDFDRLPEHKKVHINSNPEKYTVE